MSASTDNGVIRVCAAALVLVALTSCGHPTQQPDVTSTSAATTTTTPPPALPPPPPITPAEFAPIADLVNAEIAGHRLPGAVVLVGHDGQVVYRQAFGARKLPGEPGLDGNAAPAEPMTTDTIFDLASMTKALATTTAIMQLREQGRIDVDQPVQAYLPGFNPTDDPRRAQVTIRMLLTHTSGIGGDLSMQGPWGLNPADKATGIHLAEVSSLEFGPGEGFHYNDINFILLGEILEQITGQPEDQYVAEHVFGPLDMADTRYLPPAKACGPERIRGNATALDHDLPQPADCPPGSWSTELLARIAPTALDEDNQADPALNPDFGRPLRGTVHDPTARRLGGVSGNAGVFSTADDVGRFAQALLDRRAGNASAFPLTQSSVLTMSTPQQPPPITAQRGFGWDIDTPLSGPRGLAFPIGSFGHTGFTGVSLWMDPGSDTYVVVLANVIHQRGGPPITKLAGEVATAAGRALHLYS